MVIRSIAQKISPLARKPLLASGRSIRNNSKHMLSHVIREDSYYYRRRCNIRFSVKGKTKPEQNRNETKNRTEMKECQVCSNFVVKCSFRDFAAAQQCTIKR